MSAKQAKIMLEQRMNQSVIRKAGVELLRTMSHREFLDLARPADKAEELRYSRAWLEANSEPVKLPREQLLVSDNARLNQPFKDMAANFID